MSEVRTKLNRSSGVRRYWLFPSLSLRAPRAQRLLPKSAHNVVRSFCWVRISVIPAGQPGHWLVEWQQLPTRLKLQVFGSALWRRYVQL